jgi:hypothetical protein
VTVNQLLSSTLNPKVFIFLLLLYLNSLRSARKPKGNKAERKTTFRQLISIFIEIFFLMGKKFKWGILAPGKMSAKFTRGLKLLDNVELYAVGSRNPERAKQFAEEFGFKKHFGSYNELVLDPGVEIVYIASPHSCHYEHTLL